MIINATVEIVECVTVKTDTMTLAENIPLYPRLRVSCRISHSPSALLKIASEHEE